jgi:hypothetical protein
MKRSGLIVWRAGWLAGLLSCAGSAQAQDRLPAPIVEVAAGALNFPDDGGMVTEGFVGGTLRFYLRPRLSVGPELSYVTGERHHHLILTGNVTIDVIGPTRGAPARVTPFFVAGAGLYRTSEQFPFEDFTHTEGSFTAGGGVRALVGSRVTVGAEARVGWELHVRVNGVVGIQLGR